MGKDKQTGKHRQEQTRQDMRHSTSLLTWNFQKDNVMKRKRSGDMEMGTAFAPLKRLSRSNHRSTV